MLQLCIDFANYTPVPTPANVACWRQQGYVRAIIGASYGSVAKRQILACQQGGMEVEAFAWVAFSGNWQLNIDRAVAVCRDTTVKRIWTDAEAPTGGQAATTIQRIAEAVAYIESFGFATGIYTGGWWWKPNTRDSQAFKHLPLWTAEYKDPSGQPTLYGGWTKAAMWQYAGTIQTCGLNTDRNVILEEGRMYTDAEIDAKVGAVLAAIGDTNKKLDELTENIQQTFALANRNQDRLNRAGIPQ